MSSLGLHGALGAKAAEDAAVSSNAWIPWPGWALFWSCLCGSGGAFQILAGKVGIPSGPSEGETWAAFEPMVAHSYIQSKTRKTTKKYLSNSNSEYILSGVMMSYGRNCFHLLISLFL